MNSVRLRAEATADVVWLALAFLLLAFYATRTLDLDAHPAEDAAMLMRYAEHLAAGQGIVWNPGQAPVDGATDFLPMVLVAALHRVGLSTRGAVWLLCLAAHAVTVVLVYGGARRWGQLPRWLAFVSAAYVAVGPALAHTAQYFAAPMFGCAAAATWYLAHAVADRPESRRRAAAFASSALLMGLVRPEGVFLAGFMALSVLFAVGWRRALAALTCLTVCFGIGGGAYFFWRWSYFGHPLPNPFYKKGGGTLHVDSLKVSIQNVSRLCRPFIWTLPLGLRSRATMRSLIFLLIPVAGFTGIWILLSNEMNITMRFQYAVLPLMAMSWGSVVRGLREDLRLPPLSSLTFRVRAAAFLLAALVAIQVVRYPRAFSFAPPSGDGRYEVAQVLERFADRGYTLATSEAGLLPLYSRWAATDTWGLNDAWIAHHGGIVTEEYLDRRKPDVIMFHAAFSPLAPPREIADPRDRAWQEMALTLQRYAEKHRFVLAAAWGITPNEAHYYYVRSDLPDRDAIVAGIRGARYVWVFSGVTAVDFASVGAPPSREQ